MNGTFAERLVKLREYFAGPRGQRTFAQLVDVKQQSISNYERGAMPSADVLARIVRATGVSADWLLTGRTEMFPEGARPVELGPPESHYVDERGRTFTADEVARRHGIKPKRLNRLARDLLGFSGAEKRAPREPQIVLIDEKGTTQVYKLQRVNAPSIEDTVHVKVINDELRIYVPADVMQHYEIRITAE